MVVVAFMGREAVAAPHQAAAAAASARVLCP